MPTFPRSDGYWKLIILVFPVAAFITFNRPFAPQYDFWEHAASVRALAQDLLNPANPFLQLPGSTSPRFIPYILILGVIENLTRLNIFTLIAMAAVANYFFWAIGLYLLIRTLYNDRQMPLYVLFTCWLCWGKGWDYSNGYQLEVFLIGLTDPYMFSYALSFFALSLLVIFARSGKWTALAGYVLLMAVNFVNHPPTAAFCFITGCAIVVTAGKELIGRGIFGLALASIAVVGAGAAWPYFSYYKTFFHGLGDNWFQARLYSNFVTGLGPALIGIPILILQFLKRQHRFILVGFSFNLLMYVAGYVTGIEMGERFVLFAAFFLHLAIAAYVREKAPLNWQNTKNWLAQLRASKSSVQVEEKLLISMTMAFLLVFAVIFRVQAMSLHLGRVLDIRPKLSLHAYESPVDKYVVLEEYLDSSAVVLSDLTTCWMIPAFTGAKVVAVYHNNPLLGAENARREAAIQAYFDPATTISQKAAILRKYRVSHVVVNFDYTKLKREDAIALMRGLGFLLAEASGMLIFKVAEEIKFSSQATPIPEVP